MTAHELIVMRRPRRRTHLVLTDAPMCGTRTALTNATITRLPMNGGATARLKNDLIRELDNTSCHHCARLALAMIALYATRDNGIPW